MGISCRLAELGFWGGGPALGQALGAIEQEKKEAEESNRARDVANINAAASRYNAMAHLLGIQMQQNNPLGWATLGSNERLADAKNSQDLMKWMIGERRSDQRTQLQTQATTDAAKIRANAPQKMPAPPALKDVALTQAANSIMTAANKDKDRPALMTMEEAQMLAQARHVQNWYQSVIPFLRMNGLGGVQTGGQ